MAARRDADVIVAGGGPAGSTLAWDLARHGVRVVVLERTRFPREKVCGDYVEPRGLRILQRMGCLGRLEESGPLPITHSATFVDGECRYSGEIPFYGQGGDLPPHGYIVPRDELDDVMLTAAAEAGATVHQETTVTAVDAGSRGVEVTARHGARTARYRARLVAGADGASSLVARSAGLAVDDARHTAVAQRAYATVEGVREAVFFFDEDTFPGYGWMFPLAGGRVNLGVGILSETRHRLDVHVPALFAEFVERLRRTHPQLRGPRALRPADRRHRQDLRRRRAEPLRRRRPRRRRRQLRRPYDGRGHHASHGVRAPGHPGAARRARGGSCRRRAAVGLRGGVPRLLRPGDDLP